MQHPATLACEGSIRAKKLHKRQTYDVLPRAGVIGAGTSNIIACQRVLPEGRTGPLQERPLAQVYHKTAFSARESRKYGKLAARRFPHRLKIGGPRAVARHTRI